MSEPRVYRQHRFQAPPGATELLLIRHGESKAHVEGQSFDVVDGHGDPPLSDEGREQAERVGERLANERINAIYVTTLQRTAETAAPLASRIGVLPSVEADFREVFLGEWEGGLLRQRVAERDPVALEMFEKQRWDVIPGAESSEALDARVRGAIERIAAAHPDERVAVFAHGGTIGAALALATSSSGWAFVGCDNASISHLVITPDRWILRRFNDTAHLDDGMTVIAEPLT